MHGMTGDEDDGSLLTAYLVTAFQTRDGTWLKKSYKMLYKSPTIQSTFSDLPNVLL